MITLKGQHIFLRALEPEDLDFLFSVENDEAFWEVSNTQAPFSKYILEQYLLNSFKDIYAFLSCAAYSPGSSFCCQKLFTTTKIGEEFAR